jgi:DDE superfamily endonuclease
MDESGADLGITQKFYIIGPAEKKDARISTDKNREWAILIEIIRAIGDVIKPFFINKGMYVLFDFIEIMVKLGITLVVTYNGWSNNNMAIEYLNHFHKHARPIGVYRLLLLDGYGSHVTFRFKALANDYKIILLYLPAHTTHRLQPLDVGIFGP